MGEAAQGLEGAIKGRLVSGWHPLTIGLLLTEGMVSNDVQVGHPGLACLGWDCEGSTARMGFDPEFGGCRLSCFELGCCCVVESPSRRPRS